MGQAQANARLTAEYLAAQPPAAEASLLFLGAGTGQMFDFVSASILLPYQTTFTDINESYLDRLSGRLRTVEGLRYATVVDDVENTRLTPGFHTVLAVLLLEHVDWRKAVSTISSLAAERAFVIIQENPAALATAITPTREIAGTMKIFTEVHPSLIPRDELEAELARNGFVPNYSAEEVVADDKKMLAIGFERAR
ncbi:MAG: hypothetical protein ACHQLQ_06275 [Candidatus Acidiferrales bacterium]